MPEPTARLCSVHMDEPCPSGHCNEKCNARWHRRRAVTTDDEFGPLCAECARDVGASRGFERHEAAKYAAACGYDS